MTYFERNNDDAPMSVDELLDLAERRPSWMASGACRTERAQTLAWTFGLSQAVDLFMPPIGQGRRGMAEIHAARGICETCGVQGECLAYALAHHPQAGTWGGTSLPERTAMKKKEGHTR
ncbi:MAG: WhiB family transcriptional regulator [Actinomycetes bacterium]